MSLSVHQFRQLIDDVNYWSCDIPQILELIAEAPPICIEEQGFLTAVYISRQRYENQAYHKLFHREYNLFNEHFTCPLSELQSHAESANSEFEQGVFSGLIAARRMHDILTTELH